MIKRKTKSFRTRRRQGSTLQCALYSRKLPSYPAWCEAMASTRTYQDRAPVHESSIPAAGNILALCSSCYSQFFKGWVCAFIHELLMLDCSLWSHFVTGKTRKTSSKPDLIDRVDDPLRDSWVFVEDYHNLEEIPGGESM